MLALRAGQQKLQRMGLDPPDVVVVGASIAGCTAATLFARRGLRVALVERRPSTAAFKTTCTHFIQPSATPTIRRLGLDGPIEQAGGVRNAIDLWTRHGWARHPGGDLGHGYSIRRERLDPLLRSFAASTPGVDLMLGQRVTGLITECKRVAGVVVAAPDGDERELRANLVVAADGATSTLARLGHVPTVILPNRRFSYWAYFRDLPLATAQTAQLWFCDPVVSYAFPNDDSLTLVAYWGLDRDLPRIKPRVDSVVRSHFAILPDAPPMRDATRVSQWLGKMSMPNLRRRPVHHGMALIGDAAQASDPVWGVGCGWAFQSAEWLVEATTDVLHSGRELAPALRDYSRRHRNELLVHLLQIADYSTGRRLRPPEHLLFAAATRDEATAHHMHGVAGRTLPGHAFMSPKAFGRAAAVLALRRRDAPVLASNAQLP